MKYNPNLPFNLQSRVFIMPELDHTGIIISVGADEKSYYVIDDETYGIRLIASHNLRLKE